MNDFTKMELIALENAMETMLILHPTQDGKSPLLEKIQFMINNYHETNLPTMANYCCKKCNEEWHNCECKKCST